MTANTTNEVRLKIRGTQITPDGEKDTIELITEGKCYEKNNCTFLVYDESEISGMEGSTTTLKIEDTKIMMKRFGAAESKLIFEKGVKHISVYQTMYGNMDMEVTTSQIDIKKDKRGLKKINLSYKLGVCGNTNIKNKLSVEVM